VFLPINVGSIDHHEAKKLLFGQLNIFHFVHDISICQQDSELINV
jgi:hypothetical protein